jgi:hypothetical protein
VTWFSEEHRRACEIRIKFEKDWIPTRVGGIASDFLDIACSFDDIQGTKTHRDNCKGLPSVQPSPALLRFSRFGCGHSSIRRCLLSCFVCVAMKAQKENKEAVSMGLGTKV